MTAAHAAYIVVLDRDIREDDAERILAAIRMISHVRAVTPVEADHAQVIARARLNSRWQEALRQLASEGPGMPL